VKTQKTLSVALSTVLLTFCKALILWLSLPKRRSQMPIACGVGTLSVSPAKDNLDFIKISQDALPKGTNIKKLRIDAAGYQASIIDYCFEHDIELVICSGAWVLLLLSNSKSNSTCPVTELLCTTKSKTLPLLPIKWRILKVACPSMALPFLSTKGCQMPCILIFVVCLTTCLY
jgi:hypothetical protein